ncbi:hypothetical protein ACISU4_22450 [Streptomyces wuyuanensis]
MAFRLVMPSGAEKVGDIVERMVYPAAFAPRATRCANSHAGLSWVVLD